MKLWYGLLSYLAFVVGLLGAVTAGISALSSEVSRQASNSQDAESARAIQTTGVAARDDVPEDPNRTPVWIAATPKFDYVPTALELQLQRPVPGGEARRAFGKARGTNAPAPRAAEAARAPDGRSGRAPDARKDGRRAINAAIRDPAQGAERRAAPRQSFGYAPVRRDNDPFYRD